MQVSTSLIKQRARELIPALFENRLTVLGVAAVVLASAAIGAAFPDALRAGQPAVWTDIANEVPVHRLSGHSVFPLLGQRLRDSAGSEIGQIAGVLVDQWRRPRAVVVDFGGFLGIGMRKVAVDWQALQFYGGGKREVVVTALSPSQLARAPQYRASDQSVAVVSRPNLGYGP